MSEIKFRYILSILDGRDKEIRKVKVFLGINRLKAHAGFIGMMAQEICNQNNIDRSSFGYYALVGEDLFTGLKDKNGEDIYDGDILSCGNNAVVRFVRGRFQPIYDRGEAEEMEDEFWRFCGDIEVIGNVHINKELLNGEA